MVILCELEMYFPPAFFDVTVHLLVHIVEDIIQLGPTFLHSMMPFERMISSMIWTSRCTITSKNAGGKYISS